MDSVRDFQKEIHSLISDRNMTVQQWKDATRKSRNLLEIKDANVSKILYIKISNSEKGFWGLTKNQVDNLNVKTIKWYAIFLKKGFDLGYIFSDIDVNKRICDGTFELSRDGDYKINEASDCDSSKLFHGMDDLISKIGLS